VEPDADAAEELARYKTALSENASLRRRLRDAQMRLKVRSALR
jgi:hypothetical protein